MSELSPFMNIIYYFLKFICFIKSTITSFIYNPYKNLEMAVYENNIVQIDEINLLYPCVKKTVFHKCFPIDLVIFLLTGKKGGLETIELCPNPKQFVYNITYCDGFKVLVKSNLLQEQEQEQKQFAFTNQDLLYATLQNLEKKNKKEITNFINDYFLSFNKRASFTVNEIINILFSLNIITHTEYITFYNKEIEFVFYNNDIVCETKHGNDTIVLI